MINILNNCKSVDCLYIYPKHIDVDFEVQLLSCIDELNNRPFHSDRFLHSLTVFIAAHSNTDYEWMHREAVKLLSDFLSPLPPFTIVAQAPTSPLLVAVEVITMDRQSGSKMEYKNFRGVPYLTLSGLGWKELVAGGISHPDLTERIDIQSQGCFEFLSQLLAHEGMGFANIVRQWNYIEGIVDCVGGSQHYQIFNDVRSIFYSKASFASGYPAATGIGTTAGGITLGVIARLVSNAPHRILPIRNPHQLDAHSYSPRVLQENLLATRHKKTTPKFERGKLIELDGLALVYVSGTAAIKGEDTVDEGNLEGQTHTTLDNIEQLVSIENLLIQHPQLPYTRSRVLHLRVYVKEQSQMATALKVCTTRYPSIPIMAICADICRPCLLVEIECMAEMW